MKYNTLDDILMAVDQIKKEIPQGKAKRKCDSLKEDIKQMYDKLYYESFFDKRFQLANYNRLIFDVANIDKAKMYLMFVHIPKLQREYYNEDNKIALATSFINKLKDIVYNEEGLVLRNLYIVSDYVVMILDKHNVERIYKIIKEIKTKDNLLNYQLYFHKFEYLSSKPNKNLKSVIKKANKVFSGKQEFEPTMEEE